MQIAVQQQAMHVIGGSARWRETKEWVAEVFHALPELAAEVEVASRSNVEGNEFDRRPEIVWPCGILLIRPEHRRSAESGRASADRAVPGRRLEGKTGGAI